MFEWLKIKPITSVGIDIDDNSIKILELRKTHAGLDVASSAIHKKDNIADIIKLYSKKFIIMGVPYSAIISKIIQLDAKLTEEEIENYLLMNMKKLTSFIAQNINMDFKILDQTSANKLNVELIAARREQVDKKISLLENIKVKVIDVEAFALQRAVSLQLDNHNDTIAAINLKTNSLLFCVLQHKKIIYVKEENIGEQNVEQLINKELQLFFATRSLNIKQIIIAGENAKAELLDGIYKKTNIETILANPFNLDPALILSCGLALWRFAHD